MFIAIRVDGGPAQGLGHLYRCLAIANELVDRGHRVIMFANEGCPKPVDLDDRVDFCWLVYNTLTMKADWLIVDSYDIDSYWETNSARVLGARLMVLDDLGRNHNEAIIINPNGIRNIVYRIDPQGNTTHAGLAYCPVRPEFRKYQWKYPGNKDVFVHMQGAYHLQEKMYCAVQDSGWTGVETGGVELLSAKEYARALSRCCLAINFGGLSLVERCTVGVPTIAICNGENQRPTINALKSVGAILSVEPTADNIKFILEGIDEFDLTELSSKARECCDGRGAERIANIICGA